MTEHPQKKGDSISFRLTTSIILTVTLVSAISIFIGYMDATRKARIELEKSVEENTSAIAEILQVPLWTYDQETIENIGALYAASRDIVSLTIVDSLGQTLFKTEKKEESNPVFKSRKVMFDGKVAGTVEMGLSFQKHRETIRQILWAGIITMIINLSVLILFTGFFLRRFLKNPLNILSDIVGAYASGNYEYPGQPLPYIEFQPVVDLIKSMGRKILLQIGELRQAEQKYRGIFENAVEGIFQLSLTGEFLSANPSMARILGYDSPSELMKLIKKAGKQCFESREDFRRITTELIHKNELTGFETKGIKKNGESFWASISARAVKDHEGEIEFFEGSIMDISHQKEKEEAERKQKAADAANQAKTLFIAQMSHELRTPLTSLIGMAEMLMETHPTEEQLEHINLLKNSGEYLATIINDILDFSKIEAQQLFLDDIPFDLFMVVEEAIAIINVRAKKKNLPVSFSISADIIRSLSGDPVRLKQILINLLGNAVKFTKEGQVRMAVEKFSEGDAPAAHETLIFRVIDTGIGIPKEKQDIIFESFTQADTFINRQFGGTGLGLSICKRLVRLMGGTIGVESMEGEGSTFFVILPFKKSGKTLQTDSAGQLKFDEESRPITILLADDMEPNRSVFHKYLQKSPVSIVDAANGEEAFEIFKNGTFDLVIMDIEMPVMNGLEATKKIRAWEKDKALKKTPLIFLSAHAFGEQRKECFEAGCNDLLVKPVRKADLLKAVFSIIKREGKDSGCKKEEASQERGLANPVQETPPPAKVLIDLIFKDLIDGFFAYFNETLSKMEMAAAKKNFDDLYRLGHGLKGSARNYEFFYLGDLFFNIEKAAAEKSIEKATLFMSKARQYLETVDVEFVEKD